MDCGTGQTNNLDFDCANTPEWLGQRWEGDNNHDQDRNENRQFNGLDYMALYNIYLLHYGTNGQDYFNPDRPQDNPSSGNNMTGPDALCPVHTGAYQVIASNTPATIQNLSWTTSNNLEVLNAYAPSNADIRANTVGTPSFIQADFQEVRQIQQLYDGVPFEHVMVSVLGAADVPIQTGPYYAPINDVCDFSYTKPISTLRPVDISLDIEPCYDLCTAEAVGLITANTTLNWSMVTYDGRTFTATGPSVEFCHWLHGNLPSSAQITLTVSHPDCGVYTITVSVYFTPCGGEERQVIVQPNPAQNNIQVTLRSNGQNFSVPGSGAAILITRTSGGNNSLSTTVYANGQSINVSSLPNGTYNLQAAATGFPATNTGFIISR